MPFSYSWWETDPYQIISNTFAYLTLAPRTNQTTCLNEMHQAFAIAQSIEPNHVFTSLSLCSVLSPVHPRRKRQTFAKVSRCSYHESRSLSSCFPSMVTWIRCVCNTLVGARSVRNNLPTLPLAVMQDDVSIARDSDVAPMVSCRT